MQNAKDLAIKLIDEMPESKVNEVIDFLLFIKNKREIKAVSSSDKLEEKRKIFEKERKIPEEYFKITPSVKRLMGVIQLEKDFDFKRNYSNYLDKKYE